MECVSNKQVAIKNLEIVEIDINRYLVVFRSSNSAGK